MGLARSGSEYEAFCFDQAVITWGTYVTNEIDSIDGKNPKSVERKRARRLEQLLSKNDPPGARKNRAKSFADPADMFK